MTTRQRVDDASLGTVTGGEPSWFFGGRPYGLEPITLPMSTADASSSPLLNVNDPLPTEGAQGIASDVEPCEDEALLYSFRWITGHQVSFVAWQLMARSLDDLAAGLVDSDRAENELAACIRGYCAMLLYTGSCSSELYNDVIRTTMRLRHPGFSGSWAPDFWPVRHIFRNRSTAVETFSNNGTVQDALTLYHDVHAGVAAKLVPEGRSLLRRSPVIRQDIRLLHALFDNYFLTSRGPVSWTEVLAQMSRRSRVIVQDLVVNGLDGSAPIELAFLPTELCSPEALDCARHIPELLDQVLDVGRVQLERLSEEFTPRSNMNARSD